MTLKWYKLKTKKGEKLLAKIIPDAYVIALAIDGKMKSSEELADTIDKLGTYGKSKITFIIGGSLGLSHEVLNEQMKNSPSLK